MLPADRRRKKAIAVVGGGRWARVFLAALTSFELPHPLVVVSASNSEQLASFGGEVGIPFTVLSDLEQLVAEYDVVAGIVVNAARLHFGAASRLISIGASVLIEKPLALRIAEVDSLYESAAKSGVDIIPSLTYLHCSYLAKFARFVNDRRSLVTDVELEWTDPASETRYGEHKNYDPGISVAQDVMPHVWSILFAILGRSRAPVEVRSCAIERGGRRAQYQLVFGGVVCRVAIEREAEARRRILTMALSSGPPLEIDFSTEPGSIAVGSDKHSGDSNWRRSVKPVQLQLQAFLGRRERRNIRSSFEAAVGSVGLAERSDELLKEQQRSLLAACHPYAIDESVAYAIRELCGPRLYRSNLIRPGDRKALDHETGEIIQALRRDQHRNNADCLAALQRLTATESIP